MSTYIIKKKFIFCPPHVNFYRPFSSFFMYSEYNEIHKFIYISEVYRKNVALYFLKTKYELFCGVVKRYLCGFELREKISRC